MANSKCSQNKAADKPSLLGKPDKASGKKNLFTQLHFSSMNMKYWRILIKASCCAMIHFWFLSVEVFGVFQESKNFGIYSYITDKLFSFIYLLFVKPNQTTQKTKQKNNTFSVGLESLISNVTVYCRVLNASFQHHGQHQRWLPVSRIRARLY